MKPPARVPTQAPAVPDKDDPQRIISSVSHELRTPLNGILGVIELIGRTELDDRQRRLLKTLDQSAQLMLKTLDDLKRRQNAKGTLAAPAVANVAEPTEQAPGNEVEAAPLEQPQSAQFVPPGDAAILPEEIVAQHEADGWQDIAAPEQAAVAHETAASGETGAPYEVAASQEVVADAACGPARLDICEFLEGIASEVGAELAGRGLRMALYLGTNLPSEIHTDQTSLRDAVTNLIRHATQYGPIYVTARQAAGSTGKVLKLSIRKMMPGPDEVGELAPPPAVEVPDNSFMLRAQEASDLLQGEILKHNASDDSWSYELVIPVDVAADATTSGPSELFTGERVLVSINSETERQIVANYLSSQGADVITAASSWEASELVRSSVAIDAPVAMIILEEDPSWTKTQGFLREIEVASTSYPMPRALIIGRPAGKAANRPDFPPADVGFLERPILRSKLLAETALALGNRSADAGSTDAGLGQSAGSSDDIGQTGQAPRGGKGDIGAHILMAEDILINQEVMREHLAELGCTVDIAENGVEAVNAFQKGRYDIILMDCQMPEMDGLTATHAIRLLERKAGAAPTPIIGVSAHVFEAERAQFLGGNKMDDFLCKPFSHEELEDCILRALEKSNRQAERGQQEPELRQAS